MDAVHAWGLEIIHAVQSVDGAALDAVFRGITALADEYVLLFMLPCIFWCFDFALGVRMVFAYLLSAYLNTGLKDLFGLPRPFEVDGEVAQLYHAEGFGLPSGHSQAAVVVWGTIAAAVRRTWFWVVAVALMVLVGFSRVYLGVHFPSDVLAGWAVGAAFLAAYLWLAPRVAAWLKGLRLVLQIAVAAALPLGMLVLHPVPDVVAATGVMMGGGVGLVLLTRLVTFTAEGSPLQRLLRLVVGAGPLILLYFGLKFVLPGEGEPLHAAMRFLRYGLVGLWAGLGAPWLFVKLRLTAQR